MYELSRVLLRGVGPQAARYENVLLDLSSAGAPVASSRQGDMFDLTEPIRRPSPASVLFLENGGGKSVLIKLVFSVILPGRREVVGTRNTRALESFVLKGDVAHVVLEWTHAGSGKRLVTGKVSQWKDRRASEESDLVERWYHFRPGSLLDLESLPIEEDGRYLGLTEYGERLRFAAEQEPALGYRSFELHGEWTDRLMALGLDPELFRYQRAMNSDEGEAADAFSLGSDQAFVNFLLSAVLPLQPARDLVEVLATYAEKLASRGDLECEKDFVEESLAILVPLEGAREKRVTAEVAQTEARNTLDLFICQIRARAAQEKQALADQDQNVTRLKDDVRRAERRRDQAKAVVAELLRRLAQLRLEDAQDAHHVAEKAWKAAVAVEKGWDALPAVLRALEATANSGRLRERVTQTKEAARPALEARDEAARCLSLSLSVMVRGLTQEATQQSERADAQDREAVDAQAEHDAEVGQAAQCEARAAGLDDRLAEVAAEITTAVTDGLLPDGMSVVDAAAQAGAEAVALRERVIEGERTVERLEEEHRRACEQYETARDELAQADHRRDIARREYQADMTAMRCLAEDLRQAGVYSGEVDDLEAEAAGLADRLARIREDAESARIDVRIARAADERALSSLEVADLLPSSIEAVHLCDLLHERQIPACTGWEYLASIPDAERREELVQKFPHLATGVLVNDMHHVDLASEILADEGVTVTGYLALGTTAALQGVGGPPPGVRLVVPLHPALYDERAGEAERLDLAVRRDEHHRQLAELDETLRTHGAFAARLAQWRESCPPGRIAGLRSALATAEESARAAHHEAATVDGLRDEAATQLSDARDRLPGLRDERTRIERRVDALRALLRSVERVAQWQSDASQARRHAHRHREVAAEARAKAGAARLAAANARRSADTMRATTARVEEELAGLPVREATGRTEAEGTTTAQPVELLRRLYRAAAEEYNRVAVGQSLLTDLRLAEAEDRAAQQALSAYAQAARATAADLLKGSGGVDAAALGAGRSSAASEVARASAQRDEQYDVLVHCRAVRAGLGDAAPGESPVDLAPFGVPRDAAHGERLAMAAQQSSNEAASLADELKRHLEALLQDHSDIRQLARGFKMLVDLFGEPVHENRAADEACEPYDGGVADARGHHDRLRAVHTAAQAAVAEAEEGERTLADRLAAHAVDPRFEELQSPSRRVILTTERAELPVRAAPWADDLRPRLRTLQIDLESIGRHRRQIVLQLVQQVREALRTLKRAQRLSQLPEGLGSWSGQQFLKIDFPEVTDETLGDVLGSVIDEAATAGTEHRSRRDARQLVLKGVETAVQPKGFRVTVLKPDVGLAVERVRVAQTRDIFSGGQILTAAIVLYCTMAALRANDRGQVRRHQHSGVLFLDNPIGRASALYLLRLQQSVARALGVQLVYTTGLYDKAALDVFPLVVRLRNDADLRARRRYLSVEDRAVAGHVSSLQDGAGGDVSAVRYFTRPSNEAAVG
ncbi:hypothetical protein [Streptomyces avicenniae]|uniref:hypothetical protein n=1 Tax=Streptomyces avicenniae TaxID=500153 RepID=UPI00069B0D00|nr:hypothetical protein [Streptomyces avicenniae]